MHFAQCVMALAKWRIHFEVWELLQGAHGDLTPRDRQVLEAEFSLRHNRHTVQILDRLVEQKEGVQTPSSLADMLKGDFVSDIEDAEYLQV